MTDQTAETYEQIRQRNIAANRNLLLSLKLSGPSLIPNLIKKQPNNKKQTKQLGEEEEKEEEEEEEEEGEEEEEEKEGKERNSSKKSKRKTKKKNKKNVLEESQVNGEGRRRSGRILNLRRVQSSHQDNSSDDEDEDQEDAEYRGGRDSAGDESDDQENRNSKTGKKRKSTWNPPRDPKRPRGSLPPKRKAKSLKGSRPNPKIFGHQIGTEVGDWWDSRMMCSQAGVHAPPVCGIYGTEEAGCYSVALSGGYEDDVDLGYAFTFTGAGGRALRGTPNNPKNLRTAPQSSDQQFTSVNAALKISCEKKNPVRVIRGFKNHSPFAPLDGYRYDGLYKVEKCWREPGQSGFQVCKFAFVRLPNQPRIPVKEGREAEAEQMYRDMGFKIEDLPPLPEERTPWTQALAKQRQERVKQAEEDKDEETNDVDMKEDDVDAVDTTSKEHEKEQVEPTLNGDSNSKKEDALEVSNDQEKEKDLDCNQPTSEKEESGKTVEEELKQAPTANNVSEEQPLEETNDEARANNVEERVEIVAQQSSTTQEQVVVDDAKLGQPNHEEKPNDEPAASALEEPVEG